MRLARALYLISLVLLGAYYPKFGRYPNYDWLALIALVVVTSKYVVEGRIPRPNLSIAAAVLLFGSGALLTIPGAQNGTRDAYSALLLLYMFALWLPLPSLLFREWKDLRWAYTAMSVAIVVTTAYAVGQRLLGWPFLGHEEFWGRMTGLTRHPNELGVFCAVAFPYPVCLAAISKGSLRRALAGAAALAALVGILLSGSITGAVTLISGAFAYWVLTSRKARIRGVVLILSGGLIVAVATTVFSKNQGSTVATRVEAFLGGKAGRFTLEQRLIGDRNAWAGIEASPIRGHGYHAEVAVVGTSIQVHNTILRAWYDGGIFTLLGVLVVLTGTLIGSLRAARVARAAGDGPALAYAAAAVAGDVALIVAMQASPVLYQRSSWIPVALAFAVTGVMRRTYRSRARIGQRLAISPGDGDFIGEIRL